MTIKEVLKGCLNSKQYETRYQGGSPHIVIKFNFEKGRFEMSLDGQAFREIKGLDWHCYQGKWDEILIPKFKVGDLAMMNTNYQSDGQCGRVKSVHTNSGMILYKIHSSLKLDIYWMNEFDESQLTFIMTANELNERLNKL